ncbi:MAG: potassium transporter TrkG [Eubacterium sp.]|nr:potassium transporter TrkG [Eubacterium sp.]
MEINRRKVLRLIALTLICMGAMMAPPLILSLGENDPQTTKAFLYPLAISVSIGLSLFFFVPPNVRALKIRDGYISIFTILLTSILVGAFPYWMGLDGCSFITAIFESTAGITTTSATVYLETLMPTSMLLWKSIEHWIGGICVLIFILSVLPVLGNGDQQLSTAESHGTLLNKVAPRTNVIIRYVIVIYIIMTLISFIYFYVVKAGAFDSLILALSTVSTSGVQLHPEGISYYGSTAIEMGVTIFCLISGMNYVLFVQMYKRNFRAVADNMELKAYLSIIAAATIIITFVLYTTENNNKNFSDSLKDSFFQVTSFMTTSGFALEDYMLWPSICIFILISLMIIGGCTASTTGSLKVLRLLIIVKLISRGITKRIHPRAVKTLKVGHSKISAKMVSSVTSFGVIFFATLLFSTWLLSMQNLDLETTFSAALGAISNDGISFGQIGMNGDYSIFHPLLQIYLCFLMVVGRLGLMTVFIVFLPSFWNPNKKVNIQ